MIQRAHLFNLLTRACDAIRDELSAAGHDDVEDHPTLRAHRDLADEIDRALTGEKRRVDRVRRDRMERYALEECPPTRSGG
jgi:hypothetical protein